VRTLSLGEDIRLEDLPDLSDTSRSSAHRIIERWLMRQISQRRFAVGDRLPSESSLAEALGVSRMTLRQGLAALESRGVLERKRGRGGGTFIVEPKIECDLTGLAGFTEQMRRASVRAGARVISATTVVAPPEVLQHLGLNRGAWVHEIVRVRSANRKPVALERSCLPALVFPDLLDHRLNGSLYSLMSLHYGQAPHTATESLEAVAANDAEARLLQVESASPLIRIERTAYTAAGLPVECASDVYRPDRARITLRTSIEATEPRIVEHKAGGTSS
jgi:GntR family transcriptional regulator